MYVYKIINILGLSMLLGDVGGVALREGFEQTDQVIQQVGACYDANQISITIYHRQSSMLETRIYHKTKN